MKLTTKLKKKLLDDYMIEVHLEQEDDILLKGKLLLNGISYAFYHPEDYKNIKSWFKAEHKFSDEVMKPNHFRDHMDLLEIKKEKDLLNSLVSTQPETKKKVSKL